MSDEKYSIEQVADIVESEGLGYAIQHYMSADSIEDEDLARLWRIAKEALDQIVDGANELDDEGPEDGI
jgi:hypothetical protein